MLYARRVQQSVQTRHSRSCRFIRGRPDTDTHLFTCASSDRCLLPSRPEARRRRRGNPGHPVHTNAGQREGEAEGTTEEGKEAWSAPTVGLP